MRNEQVTVTCVTNDGLGASYFCDKTIVLSGNETRRLSEQMQAVNFRLRTSNIGYQSGFHVAGDPTLIILLAGSILLSLVNGESRLFSQGEMFIAEDFLSNDTLFTSGLHGHKAEVQGSTKLMAVHLKLQRR